jgi:hypothetical protein
MANNPTAGGEEGEGVANGTGAGEVLTETDSLSERLSACDTELGGIGGSDEEDDNDEELGSDGEESSEEYGEQLEDKGGWEPLDQGDGGQELDGMGNGSGFCPEQAIENNIVSTTKFQKNDC